MELKLPNSIGGKRDLILAAREVEQILTDRLQDDVRERYGARRVGSKIGQDLLNQLLEINQLKNDTSTLKKLQQQLEGFRQHAPAIRISFAQEPDQELYQKLIGWFRSELHPSVLVQVGVQPNIGGGFILNTGQKRYDFSLKTKILNSTPKLIEVMRRNG